MSIVFNEVFLLVYLSISFYVLILGGRFCGFLGFLVHFLHVGLI